MVVPGQAHWCDCCTSVANHRHRATLRQGLTSMVKALDSQPASATLIVYLPHLAPAGARVMASHKCGPVPHQSPQYPYALHTS